MDFDQLRREFKYDVIDYQMLMSYLKELKKPRDKISSLIFQGKLIRIKKGLYAFGENWREAPLNLEMIANLIYGPSCISFEYALSYYGLIAEQSTTVTSLTIGDSKTFETPIGIFEYKAITPEKFKVGIEYRDLGEEGGYFIASKEKAIIDLVYRTPGIRTLQQLRYFLFNEMRLDENAFQNLDKEKLKLIGEIYNKKSTVLLSNL